MKPELTDADERLIAAYTEAALKMSRELASFRNPRDRTRILQRINAILSQLDQMTADFVRDDIADHFKNGSAIALAELRALKVPDLDGEFTPIHREAVQQLAEDARLRFGSAIQAVKRDAALKLSEATKEHILQQMMVRELAGGVNPTAAVKDIIQNQGFTAIRTSNGASRSLEDYADTLVRSISADAHNEGAASRYAANGIEYARVIERETACKICLPMRNQIVWLGDPRLRPKYHPRCEGGIAPVQGIPDNPIRSPDDPRIPQATRDAMLRK